MCFVLILHVQSRAWDQPSAVPCCFFILFYFLERKQGTKKVIHFSLGKLLTFFS